MKTLRLYSITFLILLPCFSYGQLSGAYTVGGTSPDYTTLTDAVNDLNLNGMSGPITFNLRTGTYNEQVSIEEIFGSSMTNTLTIQSETGNASDVIIQHEASSVADYLIQLDGTDHVTIQHLTFIPLGTSYNRMLWLRNGTNDIDISSCVFSGSNANTAVYAQSNVDYENLSITNNAFNECPGIDCRNNLVGLHILDNTFNATYTSGSDMIYSSGPDSVFVNRNTIDNPNGSSGIYIGGCDIISEIKNNDIQVKYTGIEAGCENTIVEENTILTEASEALYIRSAPYVLIQKNEMYVSSTGRGMFIRDCGNVNQRSTIVNNVVSAGGEGFYLDNLNYADVYFNSVLTTGTDIGYEAFVWYCQYGSHCNYLDIRNNIFSNEGGGYAIVAVPRTGLVLDYNDYYSSGNTLGRWSNDLITDLPTWQTTTQLDSNSVSANPVYTAVNDLRPNQSLIDGVGITIADYITDIDDITRSTPPDMGAYEFTAMGDNAGILSLEPSTPFAQGTYPVTINLFNSGPSTLISDSLYWTVNDVMQPSVLWMGSLNPDDSTTVVLGNYQFDDVTRHEIKVWSSSPNGQMDIDQSDDTLVISNLYTTLAGDYTVGGSSPDFATLNDAKDAVNYGGLSAAVRLLIRSGTYEEQIFFTDFSGATDVHTLTIQSETGNAADVIITDDANSTVSYLLLLSESNNVIVQHLTFEGTGSYTGIIHCLGAENLIISDCVFNGYSNRGIYIEDFTTNEMYYNITIRNNQFNECREGVYAINNLTGLHILDNTFTATYTNNSNMINSSGPDSVFVGGNTISNPSGSSGISVNSCDIISEIKNNDVQVKFGGIRASSCENTIVEENSISIASTANSSNPLYNDYGLYLGNTGYISVQKNEIYGAEFSGGLLIANCGNANQRSVIVNNVVSAGGDGFHLDNLNHADIYFNSVLTIGTSIPYHQAFSWYCQYGSHCQYLDIRNNIFSNEGGGYAIVAVPRTGLVLDYNDYYSSGSTLGQWSNNTVANLTDLQFYTQQDLNSLSINPLFQANDDLHTSNIQLAAGIPIPSVTDDIDGDPRNPLTPYMGADESPVAFDDIGIVNLVSPVPPFPQGTNDIIINVVNNFTTPLTSAIISWSVDNDTIQQLNWTGNIASGTSAEVLVTQYQFDVARPYDLKIWTSNPNSQLDTYNFNDTLEVIDMYAALIGEYTIGSNNTDFETVAEAIEALESGGVVGEVTFNIQDGIYQENVEINQISGASPTNRIIFQSESQDSTSVTLKSVTGSNSTIFTIDSTDYLELRHLTFEHTNNSYCIALSGGNNDVTIDNCHFDIYSIGIFISRYTNDLKITNNSFSNGAYGIYQNSNSNYSTGILISDNLFTDQTSSAINVRSFVSPIISSNTIVVNNTIGTALALIGAREEFEVIGNNLILNDATEGINISTSVANADVHGLVGNNFISINGTGTTYGMNISGSYIDIFHNNINVLSSEATAGRAINLTGNWSNLKNNIFANMGGGYAIYVSNNDDIFESDYNNFYTPGGKIGFYNGNRTSLNSWQSGSGFDTNSFNLDPEFTSNTDLHISQQLLSEQGTPLGGLAEDIDGDFRNPLTPDIGADEFTSLENNIGVIEILNPITGCDLPPNDNVVVRIKNPGSLPQSGFDVAYQLGSDMPVVETVAQTVAPGLTVDYTFNTPITLIQDSIYTITAYTLLSNDELTFNDTTLTNVISYSPVNLVVSPGSVTIDYGDTLTLEASGGLDYVWSGELEGENPYSPTLTVAPYTTQTYQVTATDENDCEATINVTVTVNSLGSLPDLQVSNVYSGLTSVQPGDSVTVTWTIANIGTGSAPVDWTEKVYIESSTGLNRTIVGQFAYDGTDTLNAGGFYNRSYDLSLPDILSLGDYGVFVVEVIPNILETPLSTANNIATESQAWNIERLLTLNLSNNEISENGSSVYCTVTRSGSTNSSLIVNVTANDPSRLNYPAQITINSGQSGRSFYISAIDNALLEGDISVDVTVSAANFTSATEEILLIDNEIPSLSINNLPSELPEGEMLSFDISTDLVLSDSLFVNIIASDSEEVPLPTPVVILPSTNSVNVQIPLPDDDVAEPNKLITITAGSAGFNSASESFTLTNDEDIPAISFGLTLDTISESAGLYATQGVITRLGNIDNVLQIDISSDAPDALYMSSTVPLGPGEMEKIFDIGVFDNQQNEGFRNIEITASVLLTSCSCTASASSAGVFSDTLVVADNDGPTLSVFVSSLSLTEGLSNAGILTIERNTSTANSLTVNLSSSDTTELVLPSTVTIPSGETSIEVPIMTKNDGVVDGNQQVVIQATASNFSPGIIWVIVTDNNKPDFQIAEVSLLQPNLPALEPFTFRTYVTNVGFSNAPSGAILKGYLSENTILDDNDLFLSEYLIEVPILVGDTIEVYDIALAPYQAGPYYLIFEINPDNLITEIQYNNNISAAVAINVEPDYNGTATVDELTFLQGENITIYGSSVRDDGTPVPNVELEVYVIVDNIRREFLVTTDGNGDYTMVFEPIPGESGHYIVGASFPNIDATVAQDEFDILGVELNGGSDYILWEIVLNDTITGTISVKNKSNTTLTNVTIQPESLPTGAFLEFDSIPILLGDETLSINYTLTGTEVSPVGSYLNIPLIVTSNENLNYEYPGWYFCQAQQGYINSEITSINRTVSNTQSNFLEFRIFNDGQGESGNITVDVPPVDFISLITMETIPSLASGDTSLVILEFRPTESLPLNTPATGQIVINAPNGNFVTIPYTVEKVSEEMGGIIVDVVDQYTYNTNEAPHVENARVRIRHYFTGETYADGYTNADGLFMADSLPEGLLRITVEAEQHDFYDNVVNILPGMDVTEVVFLSYQAITFSWDVVPTEVEDVYDIDLNMEFETNVPMPVVTIEVPDTMPELSVGEVFNFYATMTNHGLITAQEVELNFPTDDPEYEFVTNYTPIDLLAQQAIQVPVVMQLRTGGDNEELTTGDDDFDSIGEVSEFFNIEKNDYEGIAELSLSGNCTDYVNVIYSYTCGSNGLWQVGGEFYRYEGRSCTNYTDPIDFSDLNTSGFGNGGSSPNGCPGCPGNQNGGSSNNTPTVFEESSCQECIVDILLAVLGCTLPPGIANVTVGYADCIEDEFFDQMLGYGDIWLCALEVATGIGIEAGVEAEFPNFAPEINGTLSALGCIGGFHEALETCSQTSFEGIVLGENTHQLKSNTGYIPPIIEQAAEDLSQVEMAYQARLLWLEQFFEDIMYNENIGEFLQVTSTYILNDSIISSVNADSIVTAMEGYDISDSEMYGFFDRWNQTIEGWNNGVTSPNATYPNIADQDSLSYYASQMRDALDYAMNAGYSSIDEMYNGLLEIITDQGQEAQNAVCASVSINISQQLTMTREAFEGTLAVFNGHPTDMIDSLYLNLEILNPQGILSNDLFQIELIGLNQLSGIDGTGMLNAQEDGSATILFIPEPAAAPTVPVSYSFGGSIRYLDPFSGLMVTIPLLPVTLQVNPSPDLFLHYFMQRDIYGDDPLTESIEPIIPADLAVMIENNGYGAAMNVTIESAQPEMVSNENGLDIDFQLIGSNLQGESANLGLNTIPFGDIAPISAKVGQWYFTSSLLGHFVSYETSVVHLSSYGNPDLSLVSGAELHELIHTISVYGVDDGIDDFLVNEIQDANETPDAIYLSQGNLIYDVYPAQGGFFTGNILAAGNTTTLHVTPSEIGWNYIKLDDPGDGNFEIVSVTRDFDGQEIPLKNTWLSHVTLPDSQVPIYENKFHFVDDFDTSNEITYTVAWSPKDPNPPYIVSIDGPPSDVTATQVETLMVTFSEEILASTFGTEDLTLTLQGGNNLIDNSVIITEVDSVTFEVDISNLTNNDGYYVFTAQAAGVEDLTGINGEVGEQVSWTQFLSVPSVLEFSGFPENGYTNGLNTIQILFNMPIDVTTFTLDDLAILLNGNPQTGTFTITTLDAENTLFEVTGISSFIGNDDEYEFVIDITSIQSVDGTAGLATQSVAFTMDTQVPQLTNLLRFIGGGLDAQHYTGANMNFDEAIILFDTTAISLLKDGATQYLTSSEISMIDATSFKVESFGQTTYPEGDYVLDVNMSQISDLAGNFGAGNEMDSWTVNRTSEIALSGLSILPDMGYSSTDGITGTNILDLIFNINQPANEIKIYQDDNGTLTLLTTLNNVANPVTVPLVFLTGGNTSVLVEATDTNGNTATANLDIYIDEAALTAEWDLIPNQVLTEHPDTLTVTFSAQLLDTSEVQSALVLLYENNTLDASGLSIEMVSLTEFVLTGLPTVDDMLGNYSVGVDLTLFNKYTSGISGNDISFATWEIEAGNNALPIADAGLDSLVTIETTYMLDATNSYDPDSDDLTFQWYPPDGIVLDDEASATPSFVITAANQGQALDFLVSVSDGIAFSTDVVTINVNLSNVPTCTVNSIPLMDAVNSDECITSLQNWQHFSNNLGEVLFSINTMGSNLGNINANLYVDNAPINYNGDYNLMQRHYLISTENDPLSMVNVRLYFTNQEYENLTGDTAPINNELSIVRYVGTGEDDTYDPTQGGELTNIPTVLGADFNANYLEFEIDGFGEFWIRDTSVLVPVELIYFNAINRPKDVKLMWQTATELSSDYVEVQRSRNGVDFESITKVQTNGTSSTIQNYGHIDQQPFSGHSYYRLQQFDEDGSSTYSHIVAVYRKPLDVDFSVYPNPAKDEIFIDYRDGLLGDLHCVIYSTLGQEIYKTSWNIPTSEQIIVPISQLKDGVYLIQLRNGKYNETVEFIKY